MSDRYEDDNPTDAVFRAAIPGRLSGFGRRREGLLWQAPGRAALELSVFLSALAILVPVCALGAMAVAIRARKAGNARWLAALLVGGWCGILGVLVRTIAGMGLIP